MAHVTPTGRPPPGPQWYAPSTPQPNQLIKDPAIQYQKQEEEYTQYTSNPPPKSSEFIKFDYTV